MSRSLNNLLLQATLVLGSLSTVLADDGKISGAYFVGNSVTDTIRYGSLAKLAESRGHALTWGRDMIPGVPLCWLWEHPRDGFQQEPFGLYPRALTDFPWDVLSLEPFDRHLEGKDGDLAMARNFIDLALKRSPDVQVYVYCRWPRRGQAKDGSLTLDYKAKWLRKYTGGWDGTEETRDYENLDPAKDRRIDEKLALAIQDAVWSVVSTHPLAGVRTPRTTGNP